MPQSGPKRDPAQACATRAWNRLGSLFGSLMFLLFLIGLGIQAEEPLPLRVVDDKDYAPFAFLDESGVPRGITIDLWRLWSRKTGVPVEFRLMDWNEALAAVRDGKADAVGGLFRTPEREAWFDYTDRLFEFSTSIFYDRQINGIRDLDDLAGFTVGVIRGDSGDELLRTKYPGIVRREYANMSAMVHAAETGEIRVFLADTPVALHYLVRSPVGERFRPSALPVVLNKQYAAVRKGDARRLALIRDGFARIAPGEIDGIIEQWIGLPLVRRIPWQEIAWLGAAVLALLLGFVLWNLQLRRLVRRATRELAERNRELEDARTVLQRSEERLRSLSDHLPDGMLYQLRMKPDGTRQFLHISAGVVRLHGVTAEDAKRNPELLYGQVVEEDRPRLREAEEQSLATGKILDIDVRSRSAAGVTRWVHLRSVPQRLPDGSVIWNGIETDVTERRRAEDERAQALARFAGFANASQYGMGMADLDGRITYVNPTLVRMLGEPSEEACLGQHFPTAYYPPEMARRLQDEVLPALLRDGSWHGELLLRRADGRLLPTFENYFVIRDEQGRATSLADILTDITERVQAQEALQRERAMLAQIAETSPVGITVLDREGRIVFANRRAEQILGLSVEGITERRYDGVHSRKMDISYEAWGQISLGSS